MSFKDYDKKTFIADTARDFANRRISKRDFLKKLGMAGVGLSAFSAGMQQFGMSSVVYTDLHPEIYLQLAGAVGLTAVIGALYPAVKAVRLKPVEAMRKV